MPRRQGGRAADMGLALGPKWQGRRSESAQPATAACVSLLDSGIRGQLTERGDSPPASREPLCSKVL